MKQLSELHKRKISISLIGHKVSEKVIQRMNSENNPMKNKKSQKKSSNSHKGRHSSPSTEFKKGYIMSDETRQKISNSTKGKIISKETRQKMSENHKGMKGKHHTKESIKKMSGKNHHNFGKSAAKGAGHSKGSYYDSCLQGKIWLRSSYELAYATYLDEHKILYLYENYTYPLGDTTYTPDFFLPQFMKFIEIKGYMSQKAQEKINKFREQYPWNLEVLYKEDLVKLGIEIL